MSANDENNQSPLRIAAVIIVVVVILGAVGASGYHFFTGWRARDLAAKAKTNFDKANYRLAWLQINSAKDLRSEDPQVLRVLAIIDAAMGKVASLGHYERLARTTGLTPEDFKVRARIALRFGDDKQFTAAVDELEASGQISEAGALRTARKLWQGDLESAIREMRAAVTDSGDPALKFTLAQLLLRRYGPEADSDKSLSNEAVLASEEVLQIVDDLLGTPLRNEALAFALEEIAATPDKQQRWAAAAMEDLDAANPALLPAAALLVQSGRMTPQELHGQLRSVYDAAPLERRAAYALWLTGAGMANEALTLITSKEVGESTPAFGARTEALFATENLEAVLAAVEDGGKSDADVLFAAKARAEYARGRGDYGGAQALRESLDAAARGRRLESLIATGDALGASNVVDAKLAELCADPAVSDYAFRVARDRFSRRGRTSLLATALGHARAASPESPAVLDYTRYLALGAGEKVSLEETAAASAAEPAAVAFRITHALNLLVNNRPTDAFRVFDDITVFAAGLPPDQLAVIAAVLHAGGRTEEARAAARSIDPELLSAHEYSLIAPLRLP